jgi:hypothetical protein
LDVTGARHLREVTCSSIILYRQRHGDTHRFLTVLALGTEGPLSVTERFGVEPDAQLNPKPKA